MTFGVSWKQNFLSKNRRGYFLAKIGLLFYSSIWSHWTLVSENPDSTPSYCLILCFLENIKKKNIILVFFLHLKRNFTDQDKWLNVLLNFDLIYLKDFSIIPSKSIQGKMNFRPRILDQNYQCAATDNVTNLDFHKIKKLKKFVTMTEPALKC